MQVSDHKYSLEELMRITALLLGVFGSAGAFLAFSPLMYLLADVVESDTGRELLQTFSWIALRLCGYWIWLGCLLYTFGEKFLFVSVRTFWIVSLIYYAVLLLLLIPRDVWRGGGAPWFIPAWVIINLVVAAVFLYCYSRAKNLRNKSDASESTPDA